MKHLRKITSGLMLLSGVTHRAHFLLRDPSPANTPLAAAFGGPDGEIYLLLEHGSGGQILRLVRE